MSNPTRPDPSYSNVRLTRSNYNRRGHLLSVFNKDKSRNVRDSQLSKVEKRREPAIDEAPIGSSDEESEENGDQDIDIDLGETVERKAAAPGILRLDDRFADDGGGDAAALQRSGRGSLTFKQNGDGSVLDSPQKKSRTRPSSAMDGQSDSEDNKSDLFGLWGSSQQSKRRKSNQFGSRNRSFNKAPSSSAPSEPPSSSQNKRPKSNSRQGKKKKSKTLEKKSDFQMPRDIDISSPPQKARGKASTSKDPPPLPDSIRTDIDLLVQDDVSSLSSPLDSLSPPSSAFNFELSQAESSLPAKEDDEAPTRPKPSVCPMCKQEVDPEALMRFEAQSRRRFRDQMTFCDSHQVATAENERKIKGYPIVDWNTFDERIQGHFDDLEKLLVPESSSYYRDLLADDLKAGRAKNFRLTLAGGGLENISCGYYGTRGSGKMYRNLFIYKSFRDMAKTNHYRLQAVTTHFGHKLSSLAVVDNVVKAAGVAGYAQSVLVPELAVRLVKEDLSVDDESARQILRDSIGVGEKLNAQQNDVIPIPKELEEEQKENRANAIL